MRKFPCKHEVYELAGEAGPDELLSRFQAYFPEDFVWPRDPECFYCDQELPVAREKHAQEC